MTKGLGPVLLPASQAGIRLPSAGSERACQLKLLPLRVMILWGCRLPGSFSLLNDNSFQPNLDLWDFSVNFSCLLQKSDRCALSWNILLLKAAGLTVCVRLWEMCDPLFIFMDIPVIPKTFDKDSFFLGLYFAENFSVHMHFTSKLFSAVLQPFNQQVLVLCPTENDSPGPVGLELWLAEWSHTWIFNCLNNTLKDLLESISTSMSNVGGTLIYRSVSVFLPLAGYYPKPRTGSAVQWWELYQG